MRNKLIGGGATVSVNQWRWCGLTLRAVLLSVAVSVMNNTYLHSAYKNLPEIECMGGMVGASCRLRKRMHVLTNRGILAV